MQLGNRRECAARGLGYGPCIVRGIVSSRLTHFPPVYMFRIFIPDRYLCTSLPQRMLFSCYCLAACAARGLPSASAAAGCAWLLPLQKASDSANWQCCNVNLKLVGGLLVQHLKPRSHRKAPDSTMLHGVPWKCLGNSMGSDTQIQQGLCQTQSNYLFQVVR